MTTEQLELKDVRGPSALGGGWRRARDLLYLMASFEFKRTYFETVLGYVWSVGRPLLLFAVLLVVFTRIIRFGHLIPHYAEMLLMNIVLFGFFQEGTLTSVSSIVGQEAIVRKTQFPRLVIPVSVVLTALFNLGLNLVVTFIFIFALGVHPQVTWLLMPVLVAMLFVITTAVAMILSSLYPRLRDLSIVWSVFATALFYATPVLYPITLLHTLSTQMRNLIALNPLAPIFELARKWIIDPHAASPVVLTGGYARLAIPVGLYVLICIVAAFVFQREAPRVAEAL